MVHQVNQTVSIIVASHRPEYVGECVRHLLAACDDAADAAAELIVVADYVIEPHRVEFPRVTWLHCPDISIARKRNVGVRHARGSILGFTDDDCRPDRRWITEAASHLRSHPEIAGVEGKTVIESVSRPVGAYAQFKRLERRGYRTNNIFYRREAFLACGGFDERFSVQREDVDLAWTMLDKGFTIDFSERMIVEHRFRPRESFDLLKNCVNRRFDPLLHAKHPGRYRETIGSPVPPFIALTGALYCAAMVGLFTPWIPGWIFPALCVGSIAGHTARRTGSFRSPRHVALEFVACACAPFVLAGALIHGSMKYRSVLLG